MIHFHESGENSNQLISPPLPKIHKSRIGSSIQLLIVRKQADINAKKMTFIKLPVFRSALIENNLILQVAKMWDAPEDHISDRERVQLATLMFLNIL